MTATLSSPSPTKETAMEMTTELVTVTPEVATQWLCQNTSNRRPRKSHLARLAKDMREGRWKVTGEPIAFDEHGHLQNGQHRLLAIVESGATIPLLVVRGVPEESFDVIDQGSVRTVADSLRAIGITYAADRIGSMARYVLMYDLYPTDNWNTIGQEVTKTQVIQHGEAHADELIEADRVASGWHFGRSRYSAVAAGALLITRKHGGESDLFQEFSRGLVTGADLPERSPVLALRNYIINSRTMRQSIDRWHAQRMMMAIIRGWNYYVVGNDVQHIRVTPSMLPMPEVR